MKLFAAALLLSMSALSCLGQGYGKSTNSAFDNYYDSLMAMEYNHVLPFLGKKAYKRGYDLPFAYGISGVFFTQKQDITIDRILLGLNDGELVDFSEYIKFGPTIARTSAYTVRPDIWILPFVNVYAVLGGGTTETEVNLLEPIGFETTQQFSASSFGVGMTLAGAVGPVWIAFDNNYIFANIDVLSDPVPAFNSSLRIGNTIQMADRPDRTISIWGGVFFQNIRNDTHGSIPLTDIFPSFGQGVIIDNLYEWAETLPPPQRIIANQIIEKLEEISDGLDPETTINYTLDKKVTAPFNMLLGAQYQFSKRYMLRTEVGVLGKRTQFLLNFQYRFIDF